MDDAQTTPHRRWSGWYWLFVVEFAISLWPPFFNRVEPTWIGIPFFYWYQLLAVLICAVLTAVVYFATEHAGSDPS
jgi:apolipoprotein N-acyltransferase